MKIAIVHDYLNQFGGAERVISALHEIWPEAPIYTSIYNSKKMPDIFSSMDIRTSFMQRFPFVFNLFKWYLLFYPFAFKSFDLSEYDVILSSSSAWAKGIRKRKEQLHICYCYTPMRFVWRYDDYVKRENFGFLIKAILPLVLKPIKKWELETVKEVDNFIAISKTIAERIRMTYRRKSDIIYPPVECSLFQPSNLDQDYFLVVSRLNSYKRIDIVVKAFNRLELPLKIIGDGPDRKPLQRMANSNIEFLGRRSDEELKQYLAGCRALVFPGEEDFGIVPVEAMSVGRPVIAYRAGGAEETVIDGLTGVFFNEQMVESLVAAVNKFQLNTFEKNKIREHALKFDKEVFKERIKNLVNSKFTVFRDKEPCNN
ncbi:MAG: glycosyltransferase [Candidatus Margulisbacteria bacterium]|nr:glycosyltransferase [Candidatus Margulisiibacteriota bacterium]